MNAAELLEPDKQVLCNFGRAVEALEPDWRAKVQAAVDNPDVSNERLHSFMQQNKFKLARDTVSKHRKGACRCAR